MRGRTIVLSLVAIALFAAGSFAQELDFNGTVKHGGTFRKNIGHGLVFLLWPDSVGYNIAIEPTRSGNLHDNDFSNCVTPPYHGPNPRMLIARDFRGDQQNKLQRENRKAVTHRGFNFLLTAADQKKACAELSEALYGPVKKDKSGNPVLGFPNYKQPSLGHGVFDVLTFELDPQDPDLFTSMTFAVHLEFPKPTGSPRRTR
jgi:hypothetical protein